MGDWKFGDGVRIEEHIKDIVRIPRRFKSSEVQIVLRERYEMSHGIYDHAKAKDDHFALVRQHWCEDTIGASRLRERLEAFLDTRAGQQLNMSFTEFINQPSYVCDLQLEILEKRLPAQHAELGALLEEMKSGKK